MTLFIMWFILLELMKDLLVLLYLKRLAKSCFVLEYTVEGLRRIGMEKIPKDTILDHALLKFMKMKYIIVIHQVNDLYMYICK